MDLKIFQKNKEENKEYFWSLVIGKTWADSGVWTITNQNAQVVARGGSFSWEKGNDNSLIEAADSSLSAAMSYLQEELPEPNKVVFGLHSSWIDNGSIKEEYLGLLKELSKELELQPAGFVVISEAIVHLLKSQEGSPPNIILVGLEEESIEVTLGVAGKILGTQEVGRSMSLATDIGEGLSKLPSVHQYPTRILLYNHRSVDLESCRQELLNSSWQETGITFIHTPKIEILPEDISVLAVSLAGGAEIGQAQNLLVLQENNKDQEQQEDREELQETKNVEETNPEELGFFKNVDIAQQEEQIKPTEELLDESVEESLKQEIPLEKPEPPLFPQTNFESTPPPLQKSRFSLPKLPKTNFGQLPSFNPRLTQTHLIIIAILAMASLTVLGLAYWFLPKTEITVYISPQKLEKTLDFTAKQDATSIDPEGKIVPGRNVEVEVRGEKQKPTTGTKRIGERAKGEIAVYRVGPSITIPKGTVLGASTGLKFTLDTDIKIASGSAGPDTLGKNTDPAKATSADIGSEYNIPAGTTFKVGNYQTDTITARSIVQFQGGLARDITAVSGNDQESLEKEILADIKKQSLEKVRSELRDDEFLVDSGGKVRLDDKVFSAKSGDETETLSLSAKGKARFLIISKKDLHEFIISQVQNAIPEGYIIKSENINTNISSKRDKKNEEKLSVQATIGLLPKIQPEQLVKKITGKSPEAAREYLSQVPGYSKTKIDYKFKLPGPFSSLPHVAKNITVDIVAEK